ncbi:hypothetical protein EVAR_21979_1 [Eumeta japonica]|uniref:Uncharacterized protein n=1 Tax=Eumeta variegata TaxID=151549 RepID=A0A4C1VVC7_EUMVA|nr:hypothetical protein EVAR_21979_1 [Eumeta japonica]
MHSIPNIPYERTLNPLPSKLRSDGPPSLVIWARATRYSKNELPSRSRFKNHRNSRFPNLPTVVEPYRGQLDYTTEMGRLRLVEYHTVTEYRCEVAASIVGFRPVSVSSGILFLRPYKRYALLAYSSHLIFNARPIQIDSPPSLPLSEMSIAKFSEFQQFEEHGRPRAGGRVSIRPLRDPHAERHQHDSAHTRVLICFYIR